MEKRKKRLLKIILLGGASYGIFRVGKTSLTNQYIHKKFKAQYKATIGADFMSKEIDIDGTPVMLQIWDTAGQEKFQSLGVSFYRGADGCILVYDITSAKSFQCIEAWRDEFLLHNQPKDPQSFPFIVIGNKIDREEERKVSRSVVETWCRENYGMDSYEVSAKDSTNVEEVFVHLARKAMSQVQEEFSYSFNSELKLAREKKKKSCCA